MQLNSEPHEEGEPREKAKPKEVINDYSAWSKKMGRNREGIYVTCSASSSIEVFDHFAENNITISTRPNEKIEFTFTMRNDCEDEDILIASVYLCFSNLGFEIDDSCCQPNQYLSAKTEYKNIVSVKFLSKDIGRYEDSIILAFRKEDDEYIIIVRELIVQVEKPRAQSRMNKRITARHIYKTVNNFYHNGQPDMYPIPKRYKKLLTTFPEFDKDNESEKVIAADLRDVIETAITPDNYIRYFHTLLWLEETMIIINLTKYNMRGVTMDLDGNFLKLQVPGLCEKRPSLIKGDLVYIRPHNDDRVMFEARVIDIAESHICMQDFDPLFYNYYNLSALFDVRFFMSRLPLERKHAALDGVRSEGHTDKVFPQRCPKRIDVKTIDVFYNEMVRDNPEQRRAVEHIVAGSSGKAPYLLHGPPGTGKTVTVVEAALQIVNKYPTARILICTESNMAADHIALMITKYIHFFQLNPRMLLRANSKHRCWECMPEELICFSNGSNQENFEKLSINEFSAHNIVITTLSHSAKFAKQLEEGGQVRTVTHVFIDEAAQADEPGALVPVVGLLRPDGVLLLAGDPLQLGPLVVSRRARALGFDQSLMERLKKTCPLYSDETNNPHYMVTLLNNYRSDPTILELPNAMFYKKQLKTLAEFDPISKKNIIGDTETSEACMFHGVLSKEEKIGKSPSFFNTMELEIVEKYIKYLIEDNKVKEDDIGVIAPYIRQVYLIKQWMRVNKYYEIEVGTVESFQGKEKRVILISTVRANSSLIPLDAKHNLGFLVENKRFNVAVTRAKAKLIVIGNPKCLEKDWKWAAYMQKCREDGTYRGYDVFHEEKQQPPVDELIPHMNTLNTVGDEIA